MSRNNFVDDYSDDFEWEGDAGFDDREAERKKNKKSRLIGN